jgi:uncharacterized protein (DUF885 family)
MRLTRPLLFLVFLGVVPAVLANESRSADEQLSNILADYWDFYLAADPIAATRAGVADYNDILPSVTQRSQARKRQALQGFLRRTRDVDVASLSADGRINADLIEWVLQDAITRHDLDLVRIPFNTFTGFFMRALTASSGVAMQTPQDYEDYLSRLGEIPRYFAENIENMRRGSADGFVLPQIVIEGVLPTILAQVKASPEESSFYEPFLTMSNRLSAAEQARLRTAGAEVIASDVMPAFAKLGEFLAEEYRATEHLGAEQLPNGKAYYAFQIQRYTTLLETTPAEIHNTGLAEVARIRREMDSIIADLEFAGDFAAFTEFLLTDPQFYAKTKDELLQRVAYTAKRVDYIMPGYFGRLPRQSYGIVPVPDEIAPNYTTGAYYGAPLGARNGGAYWVNTYRLDQRPLYEIPALTLHEAVPGHHHQNALALELENVPAFRRSLGFSAFGEGWGLYAEKLGVEMGVYQTPYEHFGRLSYEMWRACRLVIDTGLHSQGWTREEAIEYLLQNTALTEANARAEIDRYISWPGQALSYKLGELKIWELRRQAESVLGDEFDLRAFHDAVLGNGELPLALLETIVTRHIDATLAATASD